MLRQTGNLDLIYIISICVLVKKSVVWKSVMHILVRYLIEEQIVAMN